MKKIVFMVLVYLMIAGLSIVQAEPQGQGNEITTQKTESAQSKGYIYQGKGPVFIPSGPYTLGKDDVVRISVRSQVEFSGDFVIGPDGKIQYPYVGDITAAGLSKEELKNVLTEQLAKYVKNPDVSVTILQYNSKAVYILGEVGRPGKYPMRGDTLELREAIIQAGLPTRDAALRRVFIIKSDIDKPKSKKVDLLAVLYHGRTKDNLNLVPGDIVFVPSTVPSELNRALGNLLSPFSSARDADLLSTHRWGASDDSL